MTTTATKGRTNTVLSRIVGVIAVTLAIACACVTPAWASSSKALDQFYDISPNGWYLNHVEWAYTEGLMTGYASSSTTFGINRDLTRAELAVIMWRYCEPQQAASYNSNYTPNNTGMRDVNGYDWYTGAANWAVSAGIIAGYSQDDGSTLFGPNDSVTREQCVTILYRYMLTRGSYVMNTSAHLVFPDAYATSDWANEGLAWAVENNIITGTWHEDETYWLEPTRNVLREEAAKIVHLSVCPGYVEPERTYVSDVVVRAYAARGIKYEYGACRPDAFDCSGFVSYCLTGNYVRLGTTYTFMTWPQVSNPQPGDVCTTSSHCGIYIGDGQMIHAPKTGDVVKIGNVQSGMIYVRYPG